jgi:DNA-binding NarL/FixJ family response regulator
LPTDVVVVVDDPTLFAESLRTALSLAGYDVDWVPAAEAGRHGLPWVASARAVPAAAVHDHDLADGPSALGLLEELVGHGVRVAVLTASDDHAQWARCLELGASGVVSKTLPLPDVVAAVDRLTAGHPVMTHAQRAQLQHEAEDHARREHELATRFARLSAEEASVLARLMEGEVAHDIARTSAQSPSVVYARVNSILTKLGVTTWLGAVGLASEHGWQPPAQAG